MKSIVLFSGGPDSLAALEVARQETDVIGLVYFSSGTASYNAVSLLSAHYQIPVRVLSYKEVLPPAYTERLLESVPYLPDRNLLFLTLTSVWAKLSKVGRAEIIYTGFCIGNPLIYDITPEFVLRLNSVLALDVEYVIQVVAPYAGKTKLEVISDLLYEFYSPIHLTWSCFREENGVEACGTCAACVRRIAAFRAFEVQDPQVYSKKAKISWTGYLTWQEYYEAAKASSL